ncbi:MAG: hypothetical protein ACM32H_00355, partial [Candidatus Aminicenantes bacterium RBG_16_66_30]
MSVQKNSEARHARGRLILPALAGLLLVMPGPRRAAAQNDEVHLKVYASPLHQGRISPMLYGGFIELLDDHVPGMWAEMLGDRGFEGILPTSTWDYFQGQPNLCDRDWDRSSDWSYDTDRPFNDKQSCRLVVPKGRAALLTQGQIAVRKGMSYPFSGWWRGGVSSVKVRVSLKAELPDGSWTTLAAADLASPGREWRRFSGKL